MSVPIKRLLTALVLGLTTLAAPTAASAEPVAAALTCNAAVSANGATVSVDWTPATGTVDRYVVERNVYGSRHYWRGRTGAAQRSFTDTASGYGGYRLNYRVKALDSSGSVLAAADCVMGYGTTFTCNVAANADGTYSLGWDAAAGNAVDYVITRKTSAADRFFWRGRTDGTTFSDGVGNGAAYQVVARTGRRLLSVADCDGGTPPPGFTMICNSVKDDFADEFSTSTGDYDPFENLPTDFVTVWYRQVEPGGPFYWRARHDTSQGDNSGLDREPIPTHVDWRNTIYRVEVWDLTQTTMLSQATCTKEY